MANWYTNCITIDAATKEELLEYIKATAEEDNLGAVDSVEAYVAALEEGNKTTDDGLWLSNPPGMFLGASALSETELSIDVRTPNALPLFKWAERVLARHEGITITGTALDTMNNDSYELSTISKKEGDGRTIYGKYMPKEWELEENQIDIPEGTVEFVVPLDKPASGKILYVEIPMSLRKIVLHDNIREIWKLGGENYNEEYNVEEVVLGKNAHSIIGTQAFRQLPHLKRIVIPQGTKVGSEVFFGCNTLEEVVIEGDIEDFAPTAFCYSNFEQLMAEKYPEYFVFHSKWNCEKKCHERKVWNPDKKCWEMSYEYPPKQEWELEENQIHIPEGTVEFVVPLDRPANGKVVCIEMPMSLRKIVLHDNIREIKELRGKNNNEKNNVEEVVLGKNAHTKIWWDAFCHFPHLKRIVIPSGTMVMKEAFRGCYELEEVVIEGDIKDIDRNAFWYSNFEQVMAERYPDYFQLHDDDGLPF